MTKEAVIGYMILAAKELNMPSRIIKEIEQEMWIQLQLNCEEASEKEYKNFK